MSPSIPFPAGFLSLAPATSTSYPKSQTPKSRQSSDVSSTSAPLTTTLLATADPTVAATKRRESTSSFSSDGSKSGLRFLKLGPVHNGEHLDGTKGDWHDVAVE